jgi:hypothetical protein
MWETQHKPTIWGWFRTSICGDLEDGELLGLPHEYQEYGYL